MPPPTEDEFATLLGYRFRDPALLTEALTHGSTVNLSEKPRRTLYYCYSTGYMPDWGGQGLHFSENINVPLTEVQTEIIRLK